MCSGDLVSTMLRTNYLLSIRHQTIQQHVAFKTERIITYSMLLEYINVDLRVHSIPHDREGGFVLSFDKTVGLCIGVSARQGTNKLVRNASTWMIEGGI